MIWPVYSSKPRLQQPVAHRIEPTVRRTLPSHIHAPIGPAGNSGVKQPKVKKEKLPKYVLRGFLQFSPGYGHAHKTYSNYHDGVVVTVRAANFDAAVEAAKKLVKKPENSERWYWQATNVA